MMMVRSSEAIVAMLVPGTSTRSWGQRLEKSGKKKLLIPRTNNPTWYTGHVIHKPYVAREIAVLHVGYTQLANMHLFRPIPRSNSCVKYTPTAFVVQIYTWGTSCVWGTCGCVGRSEFFLCSRRRLVPRLAQKHWYLVQAGCNDIQKLVPLNFALWFSRVKKWNLVGLCFMTTQENSRLAFFLLHSPRPPF